MHRFAVSASQLGASALSLDAPYRYQVPQNTAIAFGKPSGGGFINLGPQADAAVAGLIVRHKRGSEIKCEKGRRRYRPHGILGPVQHSSYVTETRMLKAKQVPVSGVPFRNLFWNPTPFFNPPVLDSSV